MPFDLKYKCEATGWKHNCGFNCFTHFIIDKLQRGSLERHYGTDAEYNRILKTFQNYYELVRAPTWSEMKDLFKKYPHPIDQEAILSPVLRKHLGVLMQDEDTVQVMLNTDFSAAFSSYLEKNIDELGDVASDVIASNKEWFKKMRKDYKNDKDEDKFGFYRQIGELYWKDTGAKKYAEFMGDLDNARFASYQHLGLLGKRLKIGLEFYTTDKDGQPVLQFRDTQAAENGWKLKLMNETVDGENKHWEFEDFYRTKDHADQHNQHYNCYVTKHKSGKNKKDNQPSVVNLENNPLIPTFNLQDANIEDDVQYTVFGWIQVHFEKLMGVALEPAAPVHTPQANASLKKRKKEDDKPVQKVHHSSHDDDDDDDEEEVIVAVHKKVKKTKNDRCGQQ